MATSPVILAMDLLEEDREIKKERMVACSDVTLTTDDRLESKTLAMMLTASRRVVRPLSRTLVDAAVPAVVASTEVVAIVKAVASTKAVIVVKVVASREEMEVALTEAETETSSQEVQLQLKKMAASAVSAAPMHQEVTVAVPVVTVEETEAVARVVEVATAMQEDLEVSAQTIMHASEQNLAPQI